ncbi:MAG: Gfo/Idh/MocA family oxidoreductase [Pirellulaceae bacterium]|nr:Gfo/Idh/MocA family oxidoreductase [Pirellulaceae bacterium]
MNLTPEEKKVGQGNYHEAMGALDRSSFTDARGVSRRDFLKGVVAAGAVSGAGLGAMYFGYGKVGDPVRVGVIGTGDQGSVLLGAVNPEYVQVVAIADIRPSNVHRAFHGDWASPAAQEARPGLMAKYGWKTREEAEQHVTVYSQDYRDLLKDPRVEAVIIGLPLHLHAPVAVEALLAGKHVLTEKLMGHNVAQCKVMGRVAAEQGLYLAVGHQRHYSILYDNAVNLIRWGVLGQLHSIQAQWHRGNLPGNDSWAQPLPGGESLPGEEGKNVRDPIAKRIAELKKWLTTERDPQRVQLYEQQLAQWEAWDRDREIDPRAYERVRLPRLHAQRRNLHLCHGRAVPVAAVDADRRRADGGARQPPAGRGRDLLQRAARRREEGASAECACGRRTVYLPLRPGSGRSRVLHLRVPGAGVRAGVPGGLSRSGQQRAGSETRDHGLPGRPEQEDHRHVFVHQR